MKAEEIKSKIAELNKQLEVVEKEEGLSSQIANLNKEVLSLKEIISSLKPTEEVKKDIKL